MRNTVNLATLGLTASFFLAASSARADDPFGTWGYPAASPRPADSATQTSPDADSPPQSSNQRPIIIRRHGPRHRDPVYSPNHPIALGIRTGVRVTENYVMGSVGGHLRIRPHHLIALEGFFDNFLGESNGMLRHDHEVGGTLQVSIVNQSRWNVYTMLGACAVLVMIDSAQPGGEMTQDIHFGIHTGMGAEYQVIHGLAIQAQIETIGYVGHDVHVYRWGSELGNNLVMYPAGQFMLGANYYF